MYFIIFLNCLSRLRCLCRDSLLGLFAKIEVFGVLLAHWSIITLRVAKIDLVTIFHCDNRWYYIIGFEVTNSTGIHHFFLHIQCFLKHINEELTFRCSLLSVFCSRSLLNLGKTTLIRIESYTVAREVFRHTEFKSVYFSPISVP